MRWYVGRGRRRRPRGAGRGEIGVYAESKIGRDRCDRVPVTTNTCFQAELAFVTGKNIFAGKGPISSRKTRATGHDWSRVSLAVGVLSRHEAHVGVLQMVPGCLLVGLGDGEQIALAVQPAGKGDRIARLPVR